MEWKRVWENGYEPLTCIHARSYHFLGKMLPQLWQMLSHQVIKLKKVLLYQRQPHLSQAYNNRLQRIKYIFHCSQNSTCSFDIIMTNRQFNSHQVYQYLYGNASLHIFNRDYHHPIIFFDQKVLQSHFKLRTRIFHKSKTKDLFPPSPILPSSLYLLLPFPPKIQHLLFLKQFFFFFDESISQTFFFFMNIFLKQIKHKK